MLAGLGADITVVPAQATLALAEALAKHVLVKHHEQVKAGHAAGSG